MSRHDASADPARDFEAWVIRTRLAQGLPARVEDVGVLARIADLLGNHQLVNRQNEQTKKDGSSTDEIAVEDTVSREPSQSGSGTNSRSQRHSQQRVVVWGCKEHQTPAGEECQGCADQGELFTHAEAAKAARRKRAR